MADETIKPAGDETTPNNVPADATPTNGDASADTDKYRSKLNITNRFLEKEGYEYNKDNGEWVKGETKPADTSKDVDVETIRNETRLIAKGYDQDEVDRAIKLAKMDNVDPMVIIEDPMFVAWKKTNDERKAAQQAQVDKENGTNSNPQDDVQYWVDKGELPKDTDLRRKVVNARMKKDKTNSKFAN